MREAGGRRCGTWSRGAVMRAMSRLRSASIARSRWAAASRSRWAPSRRSCTWRVHSGSRRSWRSRSGATLMGHRGRRRPAGAPSRATPAGGWSTMCGRSEPSTRPAPETSPARRVDRGRFPVAPQQRQPPQQQHARRADHPRIHLLDIGVVELEADALHLRVGVRHRVNGQHLQGLHVSLVPGRRPGAPTRLGRRLRSRPGGPRGARSGERGRERSPGGCHHYSSGQRQLRQSLGCREAEASAQGLASSRRPCR